MRIGCVIWVLIFEHHQCIIEPLYWWLCYCCIYLLKQLYYVYTHNQNCPQIYNHLHVKTNYLINTIWKHFITMKPIEFMCTNVLYMNVYIYIYMWIQHDHALISSTIILHLLTWNWLKQSYSRCVCHCTCMLLHRSRDRPVGRRFPRGMYTQFCNFSWKMSLSGTA